MRLTISKSVNLIIQEPQTLARDTLDKYKEYLDETCKLAVPKKKVRNLINNPWITESIILAIDKKDDLYSNWKSTCTKKDPVGDRSVHKIFSDYRRIRKHIITDEKKKYHVN